MDADHQSKSGFSVATSFVYVIGPTSNPVKIGYAEDVYGRICQLQVGNGDDLVLHKAVPVPWELANKIECEVHRRLAEHHRRGEWFNVDADVAVLIIREAADSITEERRESLERADFGRDIWSRLGRRFKIEPHAKEAVNFYVSERRVNRDNKAVKAMNSYIMQKSGPTCLTLFQHVFMDGRTVDYAVSGDGEKFERAYLNLVKAINALAEYYMHRKRVQSERLWGAQTTIAKTKAGAQAMTSAMLREETRKRKLAAQTSAIAKPKAA